MELKKFLEKLIKEGQDGIRGVPDGSGPGKGRMGLKRGNCPKKEDYDTEEEFEKAFTEWKKKQVE